MQAATVAYGCSLNPLGWWGMQLGAQCDAEAPPVGVGAVARAVHDLRRHELRRAHLAKQGGGDRVDRQGCGAGGVGRAGEGARHARREGWGRGSGQGPGPTIEVAWPSSRKATSPKSVTTGHPSGVSRTFSGLRSR